MYCTLKFFFFLSFAIGKGRWKYWNLIRRYCIQNNFESLVERDKPLILKLSYLKTKICSLTSNIFCVFAQVEKADALLSKISSALQSSQSETDIQKVVKDFYNTLKHKNENLDSVLQAKLQWKQWLNKEKRSLPGTFSPLCGQIKKKKT